MLRRGQACTVDDSTSKCRRLHVQVTAEHEERGQLEGLSGQSWKGHGENPAGSNSKCSKLTTLWPEYAEPSTSEEQQGKASLICIPVGPKNCSSYLLYQKKQNQKDHKGFLSRWEQN